MRQSLLGMSLLSLFFGCGAAEPQDDELATAVAPVPVVDAVYKLRSVLVHRRPQSEVAIGAVGQRLSAQAADHRRQ